MNHVGGIYIPEALRMACVSLFSTLMLYYTMNVIKFVLETTKYITGSECHE
jgi:hypothetical protein